MYLIDVASRVESVMLPPVSERDIPISAFKTRPDVHLDSTGHINTEESRYGTLDSTHFDQIRSARNVECRCLLRTCRR
jgi:hypothetical protein